MLNHFSSGKTDNLKRIRAYINFDTENDANECSHGLSCRLIKKLQWCFVLRVGGALKMVTSALE